MEGWLSVKTQTITYNLGFKFLVHHGVVTVPTELLCGK